MIIRMDKEQILYEDNDIIVCYKPAGTAVQTAAVRQRDMVSEILNYTKSSYVGVVHRLDQPVEGILVFARNPKAAAALSRQIAQNEMEKYYYAVISGGCLSDKEDEAIQGTLIDYLYKDGKTNTSSVVSEEEKGAKRAELFYEIRDRIKEEEIALARIKLITGRHHQIRVQMSHAGMGLLGDYKYADEDTKKLSERLQQKQIALCAYELAFRHPVTERRMLFQKEPEGKIFQKFSVKFS